MKQIIYDNVIILLAIIQTLPAITILTDTITGAAFGTCYIALLWYFWRRTTIGKWFFREFYRSSRRIEGAMFPPLDK